MAPHRFSAVWRERGRGIIGGKGIGGKGERVCINFAHKMLNITTIDKAIGKIDKKIGYNNVPKVGFEEK